VAPHGRAAPGAYERLCRLLNRAGISCLEMVAPYHGRRAPQGTEGAGCAISANLLRTVAATRQAVLEIRCAADWLETQGIRRLGLLGTSLGSCYATLAAAHDRRFVANIFNHCAGWLAEVVWSGESTREIREKLEPFLSLEGLRGIWRAISPVTYFHQLTRRPTKSLLIYGRYDRTFRREHSLRTVEAFRALGLEHRAVEMCCGHESLGWFPFNLIDAFQICAFLKEHL
jgi:dienelactone hydrolase